MNLSCMPFLPDNVVERVALAQSVASQKPPPPPVPAPAIAAPQLAPPKSPSDIDPVMLRRFVRTYMLGERNQHLWFWFLVLFLFCVLVLGMHLYTCNKHAELIKSQKRVLDIMMKLNGILRA